MPYGPDKVRLTIAVDHDLNDKLDKLSKAMHLSKTALVISLVENNIDNYANMWKLIKNPDGLDKLIVALSKQNKDTKELRKIRKQIKENPKLVDETSELFEDLTKKKKK